MSDRTSERAKKLLREARGTNDVRRLQEIFEDLQAWSEYDAMQQVLQRMIALRARYAEVNP